MALASHSKPKRKTDRQKTENNEIAVLDYRIGAAAEVLIKLWNWLYPGRRRLATTTRSVKSIGARMPQKAKSRCLFCV